MRFSAVATFLLIFLPNLVFAGPPDARYEQDFRHQSIASRPLLEVNYTSASRQAFRIRAQAYRLTGELEKPHRLLDDEGRVWLSMEIETRGGDTYSTEFSAKPSRINLYRRGPYFCEVHWFDLQPATKDGALAPVKGDLALYCYPEKILAEVTWHGLGAFDARRLRVQGISPQSFDCASFEKDTRQSFAFELFGEERPLPDSAFTLLEGEVPVHYDARKGCYVVGTTTSGSFQKEFYETPNRYETATFRLRNDARARKITICHESVVGGGIVEGGAILDGDGHPLPIVVQVSKNFAGEKEEKFYHPQDTPFSETFFPLYLEPDEAMTLTSLHLYQNWGRHMTKHWSSLGAWMDYFHSSTGVTETTCYVPFKFAGIGGVSIADFRAMSQETFWNGQPQHDNIAGHSFLSFFDGESWQHSQYESTVYRSTGPNWYDIQLNYVSTDGSIKVTADIWETPQADELRSFFHCRYEVLRPLVIADAAANFRFLSMTSAIQRLRFTRFAASGTDDLAIDFSKSPFPVKGLSLPKQNATLAVYGDHVRNRGSNAVVIRNFTGPRGMGPAVTLQVGPYRERLRSERAEDTRLVLVPDVETLELYPGDTFEIDGFWLPYGSRDNADTPRRETVTYGAASPKVTSCVRGSVISHLPVKIKAHENGAEFCIRGGRDLVPVIVTGLTDWQYPRIWRKEKGRWRLLSHARNSEHDGYQVFCDEDGTFGTVFLVGSSTAEQTLKVSVGIPIGDAKKIGLEVATSLPDRESLPSIDLFNPKDHGRIELSFPRSDPNSRASSVTWKSSEGGSLWFESNEDHGRRGGRLSPNQDDVDLEYWWQNEDGPIESRAREFRLGLRGTAFADPRLERTWILTTDGWQKAEAGAMPSTGVIAVQSADRERTLCMAWPKADRALAAGGEEIAITLKSIRTPRGRRVHFRGKLYWVEGDLEVLRQRIQWETTILH